MIEFKVNYSIEHKLWIKHRVSVLEVEEALSDPDKRKRNIKVNKKLKEATFLYVGKTETGRLLRAILIYKPNGTWLKTAMDATDFDRRFYQGKK